MIIQLNLSCKKEKTVPDPCQNCAAGACNELPVSIVSGSGTLTPFGILSQARTVVPAVAADKIVFGGGYTNGSGNTNRLDIIICQLIPGPLQH